MKTKRLISRFGSGRKIGLPEGIKTPDGESMVEFRPESRDSCDGYYEAAYDETDKGNVAFWDYITNKDGKGHKSFGKKFTMGLTEVEKAEIAKKQEQEKFIKDLKEAEFFSHTDFNSMSASALRSSAEKMGIETKDDGKALTKAQLISAIKEKLGLEVKEDEETS